VESVIVDAVIIGRTTTATVEGLMKPKIILPSLRGEDGGGGRLSFVTDDKVSRGVLMRLHYGLVTRKGNRKLGKERG